MNIELSNQIDKLNKSRAIVGISLLFLAIMSYLIFSRYTKMGLEAAEVGLFVILVDFVLIIFVASYFYYKKIINPISVYSIFVTMFLYSTLPLSKSIEFSDKLLFFILTAIFTYFLGVFIPRPKRIMTFPVFSEKTRVLYFRILSTISIASFFFEVMIMGYIPILRIFDSLNIYGDATESMTILHTFVLLAPILVFWSLILYKDGSIGKRERNLFLLLFIFLIINNFGRTTLLMFFITGLIYFEFYGKLNNKKLVAGIITFLVVFIVMGNIRTGSTGDNIKRVLRNIANTEYETSMFESYLISYSSVNFYKMNDIVELRDEIGGYSYGANALKPLMKLIGYSPDILKKNPIFDSQGRLTTYLIDPYIDFGLIGIIIFNLLYGMVSGTLFRKYIENRSPEYIISWSIIVFCLFMGFFYNAFNTMVVWLVYVSNKIILKRI